MSGGVVGSLPMVKLEGGVESGGVVVACFR